MTWWWCLDHKRVEQNGGCGSTTRVGPYDTEQQAASAMDRVRERSAKEAERDQDEK